MFRRLVVKVESVLVSSAPNNIRLSTKAMDVYKDSWKKEEAEEKCRFPERTSAETLLQQTRKQLCHLPKLLSRNFKQLTEAEKSGSHTVRVLQWNILAQGLSVGPDNFVKCPTEALNWETRRWRILEEVLVNNPDVICMQEVDHFGFLKPALESVGFNGFFYPKPDSPALYVKDSNGPDGCALFYKSDKFHMVNHEELVLKNAKKLDTNQVAVIASLKNKESNKEFSLVTTHLKAKRGWDQLRSEQGAYLIQYLSEKYRDCSLLICGDFNAESTEPVYEKFKSSQIKLDSAYTLLNGKNTEPPYTTWKIRGSLQEGTKESCRTIDYIWYSREKMKVNALLEFPSDTDIGEGRLPSYQYPSDHLSLSADILLL